MKRAETSKKYVSNALYSDQKEALSDAFVSSQNVALASRGAGSSVSTVVATSQPDGHGVRELLGVCGGVCDPEYDVEAVEVGLFVPVTEREAEAPRVWVTDVLGVRGIECVDVLVTLAAEVGVGVPVVDGERVELCVDAGVRVPVVLADAPHECVDVTLDDTDRKLDVGLWDGVDEGDISDWPTDPA